MNEIFEKIHIIITIFAALLMTVYCIIFYQGLTRTAICLIVTIIVFYVLGSMVKSYLSSKFKNDDTNDNTLHEEAGEAEKVETPNTDENTNNTINA